MIAVNGTTKKALASNDASEVAAETRAGAREMFREVLVLSRGRFARWVGAGNSVCISTRRVPAAVYLRDRWCNAWFKFSNLKLTNVRSLHCVSPSKDGVAWSAATLARTIARTGSAVITKIDMRNG
jgi:hypothetical protein